MTASRAIFRLLVLVCTLLGLAPGGPLPASAASPTPEPATALPSLETLDREQAQALIARLTDAQVREILLRRLDQVAAGPTAVVPANPAALVVDRIQALRYRLGELLAASPDLPFAALYVFDRLTKDGDPAQVVTLAVGLTVILGCATAAEAAFRRLFAGVRHDRRPPPSGDFGKLGRLASLGLIDALAIAVWVAVALLVYLVCHPDEPLVREAFSGLFLAILLTRVVLLVARVVLAPGRSDLRIAPIGDADARSLYRWTAAVVGYDALLATGGPIVYSIGLPEPLILAVGSVLQWTAISVLVVFVCLQRRRIGVLLRGHAGVISDARSEPGILAARSHVLFSVALVAMGLFGTVSRLTTGEPQGDRISATLAVLMLALLSDGLLRMVVHRLVPPAEPPEGGAPFQFAPVIVRNLRVVLVVLAAMALGRIWDVGIENVVAGRLGARIADAAFDIVTTLILASATWGVIRTAIERHAPRHEVDAQTLADGEGGGAGLSRLETLLPLFRKFALVTLVTIVGMIVVSALGVDIGPLLAGAGVVGIAIGFGAQALVRDIVSGIFFLIDDAFRVGEYIDVGSAKGAVERISIRSLRLRHHLGQINTIPFGEIRHVTNYSRDWVIMKLELRLPYDTDLEKVRRLVKRVGQELHTHPEYGPNFLQPLKSQGVHHMDDSAFIVRVKFMAKPGEQFVLRREVYRRLQEAFHQNGIRFAPRRVIVDAGSSAEVAAAAAGAMAEPTVPPGV